MAQNYLDNPRVGPTGRPLGISGHEIADEFADGIHWIKLCYGRKDIINQMVAQNPDWYQMGRLPHAYFNSYVIDSEEPLLFDASCVSSTDDFVHCVEDILDGRELEYFVVSHPDVDHSGNIERIVDRYPDVTVIAPGYGTGHELYMLDDVRKVTAGDTIDLGDHHVTFRDAPFVDSAVTIWMTEDTTDTFFPVDFLTYLHLDDECARYADEIEHKYDRLLDTALLQFYWIEWGDVDLLEAEMDYMIEEYDPQYIAPAHAPVVREGATEMLELFKDVIHECRTGDTYRHRQGITE